MNIMLVSVSDARARSACAWRLARAGGDILMQFLLEAVDVVLHSAACIGVLVARSLCAGRQQGSLTWMLNWPSVPCVGAIVFAFGFSDVRGRGVRHAIPAHQAPHGSIPSMRSAPNSRPRPKRIGLASAWLVAGLVCVEGAARLPVKPAIPPPAAARLDAAAHDYVRLALALGRTAPREIDGYSGPASLRTAASSMPPAEIARRAQDLGQRLDAPGAPGGDEGRGVCGCWRRCARCTRSRLRTPPAPCAPPSTSRRAVSMVWTMW